MINLQDAAVVSWPEGNKKPKTRQLHSTAGGGATYGAFWGFLFGLIFFMPFLGAAIGAGTGALSGSLADVGIDDDFIRQVREKVTPGTSALFALTSGATAPDRVIDELKAVRLRDPLDQPPRGAGEEAARGLRPRVVEERCRCRAVTQLTALQRGEGWAHHRGVSSQGVKDALEVRSHRALVHRSIYRGDACGECRRAVVSGDATRGVRMGVICGAVAVFTVRAVSWYGRSGERPGDEHERSRGGQDR